MSRKRTDHASKEGARTHVSAGRCLTPRTTKKPISRSGISGEGRASGGAVSKVIVDRRVPGPVNLSGSRVQIGPLLLRIELYDDRTFLADYPELDNA